MDKEYTDYILLAKTGEQVKQARAKAVRQLEEQLKEQG